MLELIPGSLIDERYVVLEHISDGGMGQLFKVRELELGRISAIKMLHPTLVGDKESRARFRTEGKFLSKLIHPNIVTFYSFGLWESRYPYLVMEYIEGLDLRKLLNKLRALPIDQCVHIAVQICDALEFSHNQGIIHRDIKPENIMVVDGLEPDFVKIFDFGLGRLNTEANLPAGFTRSGQLIGSCYYMSPEQCVGRKADHRSDLYSLSCVLYECIAGQPPLDSDNPVGLMHKHSNEWPPSLAELGIIGKESYLDRILFKGMHKDPGERYQSAHELRRDLKLFEKGEAIDLPPIIDLIATAPNIHRTPKDKPSCRLVQSLTAGLLLLAVAGILGRATIGPSPSTNSFQAPSYTASDLKNRSLGVVPRIKHATKMLAANAPITISVLKNLAEEIEATPPSELIDPDDILAIYCKLAQFSGERSPESLRIRDRCIHVLQSRSAFPAMIIAEEQKARALLVSGMPVEAESLTRKTLQDCQRFNCFDRKISLEHILSGCLMAQHKDQEAEHLLRKLCITPIHPDELKQILFDLSRFYVAHQRYAEAVQFQKKIVALGGKNPGSLLELSSTYLQLHHYVEAEKCLRQARETCEDNSDDMIAIIAMEAQLDGECGRAAAGCTLLTQWLDTHPPLTAQVRMVTKLKDGTPGFEELLHRVANEMESTSAKSLSANEINSFYAQMSWSEEGKRAPVQYWDRCIKLLEPLKDQYGIAFARTQKASWLISQGQYEQAQILLNQALGDVEARKNENQSGNLETFRELALCQSKLGHFSEARTHYQLALNCAVNPGVRANLLESFGDFYVDFKQPGKARELFEECLPSLDAKGRVRVLFKLANVCGLLKRFDSAKHCIEQARRLVTSTSSDEARLVDIADIRLKAQEGKTGTAQALFESWKKTLRPQDWSMELTGLRVMRSVAMRNDHKDESLRYLRCELELIVKHAGPNCQQALEVEGEIRNLRG